jgi:hypothetical protein
MSTSLLRPDLFSAVASHAGDALIEYSYMPAFPAVVRALRDHYDGSFACFRVDFRSRPGISRANDFELINTYCLAACYSPSPVGVPELQFDLATVGIRQPIWDRWLEWDPVRMVGRKEEAARSLGAVYLDGGQRDEYFLDVAAMALKRTLETTGLDTVRLELFDGEYVRVQGRYPIAIRFLTEALA